MLWWLCIRIEFPVVFYRERVGDGNGFLLFVRVQLGNLSIIWR